MKILKDEFMDELRTKYGAQQVDQVVTDWRTKSIFNVLDSRDKVRSSRER